ncbi:hypothetical protein HK098_006709 [Nowakowskiella sp. JEL0407]|nr:hypothetical protein HK098_006709 [Nowakowskiella sp. JEL0407]
MDPRGLFIFSPDETIQPTFPAGVYINQQQTPTQANFQFNHQPNFSLLGNLNVNAQRGQSESNSEFGVEIGSGIHSDRNNLNTPSLNPSAPFLSVTKTRHGDVTKPKCSNCVAKNTPCTFKRPHDPNFGSHKNKNIAAKQSFIEKPAKRTKSAASSSSTSSTPPATFPYPSTSSNLLTPLTYPYPSFSSIYLNIPLQTPMFETPSFSPSFYQPSMSSETLPYPPNVIDELVWGFFTNNVWPINVVHPKTYLTNRYKHSRSLLYAVCAIGALNTAIGAQISGESEPPGEALFKLGMGSLDIENPTLDDACSVWLLNYFASKTGKVNTVIYLVSVWTNMAKKMRLHVDPDIPGSTAHGKSWNLIQKEAFRRLYWSCAAIGLFTVANPSTKHPLPDHVWLSLTEDMYHGPPHYRPIQSITELCDINSVADEAGGMLNLVRTLPVFLKSVNSVFDLAVDLKVKEVQNVLDSWETRIRAVSPLMKIQPISRSQWTGIYLHMTKHNLTLLAHRYLLVRYLEIYFKKNNPVETPPPNRGSRLIDMPSPQTPESIPEIHGTEYTFIDEATMRTSLETEAFLACNSASNSVLAILKEIVQKYDRGFENASLELSICLGQLCVFLGVMTQHASNPEEQQEYVDKYYFAKEMLRRLTARVYKIAAWMVKALDEIEVTGWVRKKDTLFKIFSWDVGSDLDDMLDGDAEPFFKHM